jgi:hypothetical protein
MCRCVERRISPFNKGSAVMVLRKIKLINWIKNFEVLTLHLGVRFIEFVARKEISKEAFRSFF